MLLRPATNILSTKFIVILLFITGKSYLLRAIANYATEKNLKVCVSTPTGKLYVRYKQQLPNCRCNTVHTNFFIPVGVKDPGSINWTLSDVHLLLVDEVPFIYLKCL